MAPSAAVSGRLTRGSVYYVGQRDAELIGNGRGPKGASRMRSNASAYVLDVANTFDPELAESGPAVLGSRIDELERRAS